MSPTCVQQWALPSDVHARALHVIIGLQIISAVRSVLKYGSYNGHVKQLSSTMVSLLRSYTIID